MSKSKITKIVLLSATLLLNACGGGGSSTPASEGSSSSTSSEPDSAINQAPIVNAGADKQAQINEPITIWGGASDLDGTISSYEWTKNGEVLGTEKTLIYTPTELGTEELTLTAVDDDGESASDSMSLEVITESVEREDPLPF